MRIALFLMIVVAMPVLAAAPPGTTPPRASI
jgi:hypothetical protein